MKMLYRGNGVVTANVVNPHNHPVTGVVYDPTVTTPENYTDFFCSEALGTPTRLARRFGKFSPIVRKKSSEIYSCCEIRK